MWGIAPVAVRGNNEAAGCSRVVDELQNECAGECEGDRATERVELSVAVREGGWAGTLLGGG